MSAVMMPPDFPPSALAQIREQLRPAEVLLAIANFSVPKGNANEVKTFAVTSQRLYAFQFDQRHRHDLTMAFMNAIRLQELASVSYGRGKGLMTKETVQLQLRWHDGRVDHLSATLIEIADNFYRALRDAHDRCSMSSGGATGFLDEELADLAELRSQGLLTATDWRRAKDFFLGKAPDRREECIQNLRQLHGLYSAGVLSESEFNQKKWDVLSRP
jgi:hypothetical protein